MKWRDCTINGTPSAIDSEPTTIKARYRLKWYQRLFWSIK